SSTLPQRREATARRVEIASRLMEALASARRWCLVAPRGSVDEAVRVGGDEETARAESETSGGRRRR
ncbi:unnamed protein product, partial [Urochloa humidicola]